MKQRVLKVGGFILFCNIGLYIAIQKYLTTKKDYVLFSNGQMAVDIDGHIKQLTEPPFHQGARDTVRENRGMVAVVNGTDKTNKNKTTHSAFRNKALRFHPAPHMTRTKTEQPLLHQKEVVGESSVKVFDVAAVILVRIYKADKPKWSIVELEQWVRYMQYAGVCRVYLYDNYKYQNESLQNWIASTFSEFEVVYHDWSKNMPYSISGTQHTAYQHALDKYGTLSSWQIAFDMDEYPFASLDMNPGFLVRFLKKYSAAYPEISEFSLKNFLFLGKPSNTTFVIERMLRRTRGPANTLDKPLYQTKCVSRTTVHHNNLKCGRSKDVDPVDLRNNHYWGARLQKWGDDTPAILNKTIPDDSARQIARKMKDMSHDDKTMLSSKCLLYKQPV